MKNRGEYTVKREINKVVDRKREEEFAKAEYPIAADVAAGQETRNSNYRKQSRNGRAII